MEKVLISLPDELAARMRAVIPLRQRSQTFTHLIEEVARRERLLNECAVAVEKEETLCKVMKEWDMTIADRLDNGSN